MEVELTTEVDGKKYRLERTFRGCKGCAFENIYGKCPAICDEGICDAFQGHMTWVEVK